jgi:hypothetical protein
MLPYLLALILNPSPVTPAPPPYDVDSELVLVDGYPGDPGYVEQHVDRATGRTRFVVPIVIELDAPPPDPGADDPAGVLQRRDEPQTL